MRPSPLRSAATTATAPAPAGTADLRLEGPVSLAEEDRDVAGPVVARGQVEPAVAVEVGRGQATGDTCRSGARPRGRTDRPGSGRSCTVSSPEQATARSGRPSPSKSAAITERQSGADRELLNRREGAVAMALEDGQVGPAHGRDGEVDPAVAVEVGRGHRRRAVRWWGWSRPALNVPSP